MKLLLGIVAAMIAGLMAVLIGSVPATTAATAPACGASSDRTAAATDALPDAVGKWKGEQVRIAAELITAAASVNANEQATTILLMTAMGESSLQNLDHGDAVDNTTIGVLQQGASYGPRENRLNPTTAAKAFLARLVNIPGWETMQPTIAAHTVQINADPYHYEPFFADAQTMLTALTGKTATSGCGTAAVSGDARELAQILTKAWKKGTFQDTYHPQMVTEEILPLADGTAKPGCAVDTRVLQLLVATLNRYGSVKISDLNRPCVGITTNCPGSLHCKSPAFAVDFNAVGGNTVLGGDPTTIGYLTWADTIMPTGSQAGQVACRAPLHLTHFRQFDDTCNHLHIDLGSATDTLRTGSDTK